MEAFKQYKWESGNLSDIADITMGQSPPGNSYNDIKDGIGLINGPTEFTNKYPVVKQWTSKPTKLCKAGDILLCVRGSSTGRMNIADDEYCIGRGVASIRAKKDKAETSFIYYTLNYKVNQLLQKTAGSTFPNLSSNEIKDMIVGIPLFTEQQKIASILSTWDKAIELKEKLIEQKKEQKKGLMQKLLTGEVRLPGFNEKWEKVKLGKVATIIMGQSPTSDSYNDLQEGIPLIQGNADIKKRRTCPRIWTTKPTKKCLPGDIIMTVRAPVGSVALSHHEACIGRGVCAIRGSVNQDYLYYQLIQKENWWSKISQGSTFESVNTNDIKELKISMPPMLEQQAISKVLKIFDQDLYLLEKELVEVKSQKQGLMQLLLTGKVRVKV